MNATTKKGFKKNFTTKTLVITKAFEEDLNNGVAEAIEVVSRFQSMFSDLHIERKTHRVTAKTNPDKCLTYERMERYIRVHENAEELLALFEKVKKIASTQKNSYLYTKTWFHKQFPNYAEQPNFKNGKLYVFPLGVYNEEDKKEDAQGNNVLPLVSGED